MRSLGIVIGLLCIVNTTARAQESWRKITPDVVYGHKAGMALTFDVIEPTKNKNNVGLLFMVSGGWVSMWGPPDSIIRPSEQKSPNLFEDVVQRGYTLFLVRHGSSPQFKVPEAVDDVRIAIRTIRSRAKEFGIDPERIGVFGMSAGGHLSLMLGTTGNDAKPNDPDKLKRVSSKVQAVVSIFPPTDLEPYRTNPKMVKQFPALEYDPNRTRDVSPLFHVTKDDAPTLLIHGDKDELVPLFHSEKIKKAFEDAKIPCELEVVKGAGHGFAGKDEKRMRERLFDWFKQHLLEKR